MLVSTRGRYALRVLIDLAAYGQGQYVPMKVVAKRQDISLKYLERIMPALVKCNLVAGLSGRKGGYKLALPPETIRVGDILRLTEGSLSPVSCLKKGGCGRSAECATYPMWNKFQEMANTYFNGITIGDLVKNAPPLESCEGNTAES